MHEYKFAQEQERAGVDAIHAINTIPYAEVFGPKAVSPLANVGGGGVSGGPAKFRAYEYNKGLRSMVSVPLIFGCGAENADDVHRYMEVGADSVSICSLAIRQPREAIKILQEFNNG